MVRYLAIDLGDMRTGLAVGDDVTRIVSPGAVLETPIDARGGEALVDAIARAAAEHLGPPGPSVAVVVGLPLNMDGTEGPRAKAARAFGARLEARTGHRVIFHDERLSSARAEETLDRSGLTRDQKKARRDARAAAAILSDFLGGEVGGGEA